jgi:methyl-accepting chemotaxis protein
LGDLAGLNVVGASGNIHIGSQGTSTDSHVIRIGSTLAGGHTATFIAGISGAAAAGGTAVSVTAAGKLGTVTSSARFKDAIKPMDKASEAILALKPVTFHYKKELDPEGIPQFGLIAEDVAEVNPALVGRDGEGKIFSVRYEAVNAMLLNEFLKEHRTVQEQGATIAELRKGMEVLAATVKEQAAQIQKVSAQLEVSKPAPQIVLTDQ